VRDVIRANQTHEIAEQAVTGARLVAPRSVTNHLPAAFRAVAALQFRNQQKDGGIGTGKRDLEDWVPQSGHGSNSCGLKCGPLEPVQPLSDRASSSRELRESRKHYDVKEELCRSGQQMSPAGVVRLETSVKVREPLRFSRGLSGVFDGTIKLCLQTAVNFSVALLFPD
jgi:hypothetical protein